LVLKGETALALGDPAGARAALADAANLAGPSSPEIELLSAALAVASGEADARERYRGLARTAPPRVAALAVLRLLAADLEAGAVTRARARADLAALRLRWSGGVFAREALEVAAAAETDIARRIDALGRLAREHARSDAATLARVELQSALATLLDEESRDPRDVARLFYANVEFAPLGAAGDAMVRRLADRLIRLDLLKEAAELLDHQVFKRLRGAERSRVAADLAQVHLDDRRPSEALRVLRATRMAGVDAATLERRRLLEATALERTGSADAAL
ncbi:MAG: hypothetical protein HXY23_04365, partial [Parvularculaceae bacterium]|nr:hypothetical protein [Parvularculaceae bacterium]